MAIGIVKFSLLFVGMDVGMPAGQTGWLPAQEHWGENIGETEALLELGLAAERPVRRAVFDHFDHGAWNPVVALEDPAVTAAIRHEAEGSIRAGANSTPTFYIEGGLLIGAQPISVFRPILDSIYQERVRGEE